MRRSAADWLSPVPDGAPGADSGRGSPSGSPCSHSASRRPATVQQALTFQELSAARRLIVRILDEVPSPLTQAALFGSKARGEARRDSDVDILLVFRALPPDREPHAGHAEAIAEEVAWISGIPVTVWCVSLFDLTPGQRTPMLVDALEDAFPLWCWPEPLESVDFTPADALRCCDALLQRVREGSDEFARACRVGDVGSATRRARDDILRLGTALLLLRGVTRPRRAGIVEECLRRGILGDANSALEDALLEWIRSSFGPEGRSEDARVPPPPCSHVDLCLFIDLLRGRVVAETNQLAQRLAAGGTPLAGWV